MKRIFRRALAISSLSLLAACGGTQPPPKGPGPQPTSEPGAHPQIAGESPNLAPVSAPADLIAFGRLANPGSVIDTTAQWAKLPMDVRRMIREHEPELAQLLVLDAPLEFAVLLDPRGRGDFPTPFAVVSVGLASVEGGVAFAKKQGHEVRMVRPGVYRVTKAGPSACAIAASVGKAPARLVCGDRPEDVDALLDYATRGLPSENMGNADLHLELRVEPLRRRYQRELRQLKSMGLPFVLKELSLDSPRFDRALADAAHGLADEVLALADEVDRAVIDARVKTDTGSVDTTVALRFKGQSSWTVQTIVDASKRSKGVPEMFWKLPKDSEAASYGMGANAKRFEPIRKTLSELLDGVLEHEKIPRKVRDQASDLLADTWTTEGAMVYAHGELPPSTNTPSGFGGAAMRERLRSTIGWYVVGLEEKPAKYKAYFDKWAKLYNDAQLRQVFDKRLHLKPTDIPKLVSRGGKGLPAGSTVYELTIPGAFFGGMDMPIAPGAKPAKRAAPPGVSIQLIVVPDGDRVWIGLSTDEKLLAAKLSETVKGGGLSAREGLTAIKSAGGDSGGFFTLENFVRSIATMDEGSPADIAALVSSMPHRGGTPIIAWSKVSADGPTLNWNMQLPKAVIEDIAAVAPALANASHGGPRMRPPSPPPMPMAPPRPGKGPARPGKH